MHPSRVQMLQKSQQPQQQPHPPAQAEAEAQAQGRALKKVVMYPLKTNTVPTLDNILGDQQQFNDLRVHIVRATYQYLYARASQTQTHPDFIKHIRCWIANDGRYLTLNFNQMPGIVDNLAVMNELNRHNLLGIYWLANHHDTQGSFSRGQIYDIEIALHRIRDYYSPDMAPIIEKLRSYLDLCVDEGTPVYMEPPPLQPQTLRLPVHPQTPVQPFSYAAASEPVGEQTGLSVTQILNNLKPLVQGQYDPARPQMLAPLPPLAQQQQRSAVSS